MTATQTAWGLHPDLTADGLMRAVVEHPFDVAVRLILADRLDELGEAERAEFIRLQVFGEDLQRQFALLCDRRWTAWCYAEDRLDDGTPCRRDQRGGLCVYPSPPSMGHSEWINVVRVPSDHGLIDQKFVGGFVGEVRCPLAWWVGGECEACDNGPRNTFRGCPACHGTGTTPGHGAEVVSRHPVVKVVIADRWPAGPFNVGGRHSWVNWSPTGNDPADLPGDVFDRLAGPEVMVAEMRVKSFPAREAAVEALSRALVDIARERAGLPPIPWEVSQ